MPPLTEITWADGDDALAGGPSVISITAGATGTLITANTASPGAYTLVAGFQDNGGGDTFTGYSTLYGIGSINPGTFNGATIAAIGDLALNGFNLTLSGVLAQAFVTSVTINGVTYLGASATFLAIVNSSWTWGSLAGIANGGSYTVDIQ